MQPESLLNTGFSGCDYLIFCKIGSYAFMPNICSLKKKCSLKTKLC
ncbi:hypothetical protein QDY71_04170 [Kingella negevensis]|nr:hypothetical protein [Kingella negevensis]MDK4679809.1 hypothetical protein [Kingella negevensis]MDK4682472.1 hypothetical protein [Kingella negevensis]MDK4684637.1 hypothetical protein [Kingella negevensis]MDK4696966.1 hypothetical protein [Kingella negevensis]MDK4708146.1 hypothetical protein [Kingella negevensis]